jgi:hypothetical protein
MSRPNQPIVANPARPEHNAKQPRSGLRIRPTCICVAGAPRSAGRGTVWRSTPESSPTANESVVGNQERDRRLSLLRHPEGWLSSLRLSANASGEVLGTPEFEIQVGVAAANIRTDVPPGRVIARSRPRDPHHLTGFLGKLIECIDDRSRFHLVGNWKPELGRVWRELVIEDEIGESGKHAVRRFVRQLGGRGTRRFKGSAGSVHASRGRITAVSPTQCHS